MPLFDRPAMRLAVPTLLCCLLPPAFAQPKPATQNGEVRATRALEQARQQGPLALYAFFEYMPKGADLHTHLAGAVYAETFIREAVGDNLCVNTKTQVL